MNLFSETNCEKFDAHSEIKSGPQVAFPDYIELPESFMVKSDKNSKPHAIADHKRITQRNMLNSVNFVSCENKDTYT